MRDIRIIFTGYRRVERSYATIEEAVTDLRKRGYTKLSGDGRTVRISTYLYQASGSGAFARINTTSAPGCWPEIVAQINDWNRS